MNKVTMINIDDVVDAQSAINKAFMTISHAQSLIDCLIQVGNIGSTNDFRAQLEQLAQILQSAQGELMRSATWQTFSASPRVDMSSVLDVNNQEQLDDDIFDHALAYSDFDAFIDFEEFMTFEESSAFKDSNTVENAVKQALVSKNKIN